MKITGVQFKNKNKYGDFIWMMDMNEFTNSLFLFTDNVEYHYTNDTGECNTIIRQWNKYNKNLDKPKSAGIIINSLKNSKLITFKYIKKYINKSINEIKKLIKKYNYDNIYYLTEDDNELLKCDNIPNISKKAVVYATLLINSLKIKFDTKIKTDWSFLKTADLSCFEDIIIKSVKETKNKLLKNPPININGRTCYQNRSVGFFSNKSIGYQYSGQLAKSIKLTKNLKLLIIVINYMFNADFNGVLINYYKDGNETIGKHSDDERNLDNSGVISISYGQERIFRIRKKINNKIVLDLETNHLGLIHMGGDFQKEFTHEIPTQKKLTNGRYSLTFRHHKK
ncbi:putative alkylated DNA repair protein [Cafeteria roenbergensis virus]|uniref:Putative alkylated DNA repair protein n=1 Tax=Cafeteria roenbergensis virus (strain BV-PW1) TaxID=693272 RepID=E3T4H1_CROVB|nr:alkylated DNA repair [Cafeteria roenbergensis virus BV-PW1]ADO67084.1 putative alkylated DNA repair protein [Cafeteria roenbergensis virus BV-PW1]